MTRRRICQLPLIAEPQEPLCKWPDGIADWWHGPVIDTLTPQDVADSIDAATRLWESAAGIRMDPTPNENLAEIRLTAGPIDKQFGVLAWSEMPCGPVDHVTQRYDSAEAWTTSTNPTQSQIHLPTVIAHELGHAIGIPHLDEGNLMQPFYDGPRMTLGPQDIDEATKRYGPPKQPPPEPPGDGPMDPQACIDLIVKLITAITESCTTAAERAARKGRPNPWTTIADALQELPCVLAADQKRRREQDR